MLKRDWPDEFQKSAIITIIDQHANTALVLEWII